MSDSLTPTERAEAALKAAGFIRSGTYGFSAYHRSNPHRRDLDYANVYPDTDGQGKVIASISIADEAQHVPAYLNAKALLEALESILAAIPVEEIELVREEWGHTAAFLAIESMERARKVVAKARRRIAMDETLKVLRGLLTDIGKEQAHRKANNYREGSFVHRYNVDMIAEADSHIAALTDAIARLEALEEPNTVQVAGVPDKRFVGVCYITGGALAYRLEDDKKVLYEYDKDGKELHSMLSSHHPKPTHWKPALRFFGIR